VVIAYIKIPNIVTNKVRRKRQYEIVPFMNWAVLRIYFVKLLAAI